MTVGLDQDTLEMVLDSIDMYAEGRLADKVLLERDAEDRFPEDIVRGMCLFNDDRLTQARGAFNEACQVARTKKDSSSERICRQWITYIDKEKYRREQLRAAAAE